jgi:RNA polymerase sigma-70 factor (ECF subfamily)
LGTTTSYTEQELISLLKSRDNRAFGYLYDNYSAALFGIITQIVGDMELANDVLQEVFINVWRKIETYDPIKGRLFTWMLNIARNASIDILRSKSYQNSQKNQSISDSFDTGIAGQSLPVDIDNIGLKKVVWKLREEHRVLIELAYFKGYTHEEIAEIEDIPLGTVKTRIRSALIQLRELLK